MPETQDVIKFSVKGLDKIVDRIAKKMETGLRNTTMAKMREATDLVYKTARSIRPDITIGGRKVSNPNSKYGVPVRTGALRASIRKEVRRGRFSAIGRVTTDKEYAKFIEYGTSKMAPRAFMRPALDLNKQKIKKIFESK